MKRSFNAGLCCGEAVVHEVDDVAFLEDVVADLRRRGAGRISVVGFSNGGMMAYTLACRTDVFAAVAPVAATMLADCADPSPVSVFHLHGSADTSVRLDGEPGEGAAEVDGPRVRLFAGCGIVADSDPEAELAEAQAKFLPVRDALVGR